jgi:DNA-binding transcriptional LysR family regulator
LIVRESGSGSRHCVELALEAAGISPGDLDIALEMNSNEAIRAAVQAGLGAAFLSHATVKNEIDGGRLASVGVQSFRAQRHLFLITDPQRIPTAASRAFLTLAEQWSAENKPRRKRDGGQRS